MNINVALFVKEKHTTVEDVWQWDYGQVLRIQGLDLPKAVEIHFSLNEFSGDSVKRVGITKDRVTDVIIPDSMVERDIRVNYKFYAFIYLTDKKSGQTEYKITLNVTARPKPEAFDAPDEADRFSEAVRMVSEYAEEAEGFKETAESWAHGHEGYPERDEDNAKYYAEQAEESARNASDDKTEIQEMKKAVESSEANVNINLSETERLKSQAQTAAENASLSEQNSKAAENAAKEAMRGAENARDNAETLANEAKEQRDYVDQKVEEFELAAEYAVESINDAGDAKKSEIDNAGSSALQNIAYAETNSVENVRSEGTERIKAINAAGEEKVQGVKNEGDVQKQILINEGTNQKKAIEAYAEEVKDFREQVVKNTNALGGLSFSVNADDGGLDITI